MQKEKEKRFC